MRSIRFEPISDSSCVPGGNPATFFVVVFVAMKKTLVAASICLILPVFTSGDEKKAPPSLAGKPGEASTKSAKKEGQSPGGKTTRSLAKKTKLPPGLEKKFGKSRPDAAYVAFDPRRTDRAWLLIDGKWKLEEGFDTKLESEVKASLALPTAKPPVALPDTDAKLRVVKFE